MPSFIRNAQDFCAGVIFLCFGLAAVLLGRSYPMGTTGDMGPAYFPSVLGGLLALVGAASVLRSTVLRGAALPRFAFRNAGLIIGGTVLFGLLIRAAGLPLAIIALVMAGGLASARFRLRPFLALAAGMAVFSVLVFVKGLALPMPVLGAWFGF
jgi:putative tricarboxylic transport membrane protein